VTRQVFIEHPVDSEISKSRLFPHSGHLPNTFDSNSLGGLVRRRDQNLNSNSGSNWGALAAENERTVKCNVVRKAAFCVIRPVIPMENDW
jgi:hypothetical protein